MKKLIKSQLFVFIFLCSSFSLFGASCYQWFVEDFNDAYDEYQSDLERCSSARWNRAMCEKEAELAYVSTVESLGTAYERCILQ